MAKKRTIAIDCDDVIIPTAPAVLNHYNKTYGTQLKLKDLYSENLAAWGVSDRAIAIQRVEQYVLTGEYQNASPFHTAIEAIKRISKYHDLHIVTGRAHFLEEATKDMLIKYFPGMFRSVEFTHYFGEKSRSKGQVCQDLRADLLIDDHLHHAEVVAACGIEVLLFGDYPWNQAERLPPNITRVKDWEEIEQKLIQ